MDFTTIIQTEKNNPSVIFLDAMGTLFGLKGTVGKTYGKIAEQFDVRVDYERLNQAFYQSFKAAPPLAFSSENKAEIPSLEKQWWFKIAQNSFQQLDVMDQFSDFNQFFDTLYDYFSSKEPWFIYSDVMSSLAYWQDQGILLGIISNFDSRLHQVLKELQLSVFFSSITLSSYTGFAKPHHNIFKTALNYYQIEPHQAWHIGDSEKDDFQGATQAGIKAFLVNNNRK